MYVAPPWPYVALPSRRHARLRSSLDAVMATLCPVPPQAADGAAAADCRFNDTSANAQPGAGRPSRSACE
jgi:hypothetical protein